MPASDSQVGVTARDNVTFTSGPTDITTTAGPGASPVRTNTLFTIAAAQTVGVLDDTTIPGGTGQRLPRSRGLIHGFASKNACANPAGVIARCAGVFPGMRLLRRQCLAGGMWNRPHNDVSLV